MTSHSPHCIPCLCRGIENRGGAQVRPGGVRPRVTGMLNECEMRKVWNPAGSTAVKQPEISGCFCLQLLANGRERQFSLPPLGGSPGLCNDQLFQLLVSFPLNVLQHLCSSLL